MKLNVGHWTAHALKLWKQHPALAWIVSLGWVLVIGWLAFFWNLGEIGLIDETEPLFVEAARQMTVTGDWITPFFNEEPRFDKPPLIYWLMAIAFKTFGVNEFAARLPSAIAGLCLAGFCFYALRRFGLPINSESGETTNAESAPPTHPALQWQLWLSAWLGTAMVALHPYTFFFGRTGYSDMLLNACMGGAMLAFFMGYAQPERRTVQTRWYLACYLLIAGAILTKGPVGIVIPGFVIGAFLLYVGKFREVLREMRWRRGLLLVLALSVPWFILVTLANGQDYIDSFFGYHNVERFTSVVNKHSGPWYFHILVIFLGFVPWSVFLPAAIARVKIWRRQDWQNQPRFTHLGVFALLWLAIILGFFTIAATKYFSYVLPTMPAAAILVALWWTEQTTKVAVLKQRALSLRWSGIASLVLFALMAGLAMYSPQWLSDDPTMPNLGLRIEQANIPQLASAIWAESAIAGLILLLTRRGHWLWGINLIGYVAFLMVVIMPVAEIVDAERQLPLRELAQTVVQVERPNENLVMVVRGFHKPSLVFYTQRPVTFLKNPTKAMPYLQENVFGRSQPTSVLVLASDKALNESGLQPTQYEQIREAGIYQLVRVSNTGRS